MRPSNRLAPERLHQLCDLIEAHIAEPLGTVRLAQSVHLSRFHFCRLFKLATGESPHVYLTRRRVERAKTLLAGESLPLVHVAGAVGYQTQGHFNEVFRRHTGTTPRRFRVSFRPP